MKLESCSIIGRAGLSGLIAGQMAPIAGGAKVQTGKLFLQLMIFLFSGLYPWAAYGDVISAGSGGRLVIRGELPAGWGQMTAEERSIFENNGKAFFLQEGDLVTGYRSETGNVLADGPLILVFEARSEKQMQPEQIQKIYSWFEKQRELVTETLPTVVDRMTIENIEYVPAKATILFQSVIEMDGKDFTCISSMIFMRDGYVVLIGLARKDADKHREDISAFMRSVQVPEGRRLKLQNEQEGTASRWLAENWTRVLGLTLLFSVFAMALRRRS
jgi:hypothetical protein